MDRGIHRAGTIVEAPTPSGCYHCGLPLPQNFRFEMTIDGTPRDMCCAGCQEIAQTIVDHGLVSYYRQRSALPERGQPVPQAVRDLAAFEIPAIERTVMRDEGGAERGAALMLDGITCAACIWLVEQRVLRLSGVLGIEINFVTRRARVRWDTRRARLVEILEAITALGYRVHPNDRARGTIAPCRARSRVVAAVRCGFRHDAGHDVPSSGACDCRRDDG